MEIFDKAKDILENIEIKTGEFIYDQKSNFQIAKVCSEMKKSYEKLGRLTFRKLKGASVDDNEFDMTVQRLELLKAQLDALRDGSYGEADSVVFENGEPVDEAFSENENELYQNRRSCYRRHR